MLYNPKWSTTPSLEGFIAWLREQDPNKTYRLGSSRECAFGLYYISIGREPEGFFNDIANQLDLGYDRLALLVKTPTRTFGETLRRALALQASL